jgi:hypothetical protein
MKCPQCNSTQNHAEDTRQHLESITKQTDKTPEERLWLLFEGLNRAVQMPEFFGCPFINATAEYSDATHPFHRIAVEYKQMYRDYIFQIVEQLNVADPHALTAQLFLLIEGTLVTAQVDVQQRTSKEALTAAHILVDFLSQKMKYCLRALLHLRARTERAEKRLSDPCAYPELTLPFQQRL